MAKSFLQPFSGGSSPRAPGIYPVAPVNPGLTHRHKCAPTQTLSVSGAAGSTNPFASAAEAGEVETATPKPTNIAVTRADENRARKATTSREKPESNLRRVKLKLSDRRYYGPPRGTGPL